MFSQKLKYIIEPLLYTQMQYLCIYHQPGQRSRKSPGIEIDLSEFNNFVCDEVSTKPGVSPTYQLPHRIGAASTEGPHIGGIQSSGDHGGVCATGLNRTCPTRGGFLTVRTCNQHTQYTEINTENEAKLGHRGICSK